MSVPSSSAQPAEILSASTTSSKKSRLLAILKKIAIVLFCLWLALYLAIWIFSPMLVRHFAEKPLANLQVSLASKSTIRLNPFTSTVSIDELLLIDKNANTKLSLQEAEVSVHLHRLFAKQLYISEFSVSDLSVYIDKQDDKLVVAGIDLSAQETNAEPNNTQSSANETDSSANKYKLVLPELLLSNIELKANIDGSQQELQLSTLKVSDADLSINEQHIDLSLEALVNSAPLSVDAKASLKNKIGELRAAISLNEFSLASISALLEPFGISVDGMLSIDASPHITLNEDNIQIKNDELLLLLADLNLGAEPWIVNGQKHTISAKNLELTSALNGELISAQLSINTLLEKGNVSLAENNNSAVNWQNIKMDSQLNIEGTKPSVSIPSLSLQGLHLSEDLSLDEAAPMMAIGDIAISDIFATDINAEINQIAISGLQADIAIYENKTIRSMLDTSSLEPSQASQTTKSEDAEIPKDETNEQTSDNEQSVFAIKLNSLLLLDPGQIRVNDESVSPVFSQTLTIETLKAGPFDSQQATLQSPFEMLVVDSDYLKVDAHGYISPFAEKLNAEVNAKVAELNLPSVSPYVKDGLGFEMKSGQLDVNIELAVTNDEIDGNTNLYMRGIEMSNADDPEQGLVGQGKAMPLNAALGVLKDDNGNIDLDVPMRGNLADPSFGVESFLALVLKKAAMSQAQDYLMTTFVPYASVVSIALSGADYLLKVRFEPLVFETTQSELPASSEQFLSELTLLMQDKPEIQIKTCAQVTYADLGIVASDDTSLNEAQTSQMKTLGDARQAKLKRYLVDKGLASNRILYCASALDSASDAQPRIELNTD